MSSVLSGAISIGVTQAANTFPAGPASGPDAVPTFRSLVTADLPTGIPTANMADPYDTDFLALQYLGSAIKGYCLGNIIYQPNNPANLVSQQIFYHAVYVPKPATITGYAIFMNGTGSYTGNNYNGIGLYSINVGTGLLTQVAASTNNPTLWTAPTGILKVNFAATFSASVAVYYVAVMFSASAITTNPQTFRVQPSAAVAGMDFTNSIRLQAGLGGQTSLPATQLMSGITTSQNNINYGFLY